MRKTQLLLSLIVYSLLFIAPVSYADYVLPYPSYMPGNKLYRASRVLDGLKGYWYWGNIAAFRYNLGLSDKYLIEAKTLFEYKQYLLAADALRRSNDHFEKLPYRLKAAKNEEKDIKKLVSTAQEAADTHMKLLEDVGAEVPEEFLWQPEKIASTTLPLGRLIREAIHIRLTVSEIIKAF